MVTAGSTAKREQIATYMRDMLNQRKLKAGDVLPTEYELAKMFECSRGTVQHALTVLVGEGLIRRRRGAGSFVAGRPERPALNRIVMTVSDLGNTFIARFVQTMSLAVAERGLHLVLCSSDGRPENDLRFLDQLKGRDVLGLVRFPTCIPTERQTREAVRSMGVRCVVIDDFWTDCWNDNHVVCDERAGTEMAVAHLVGLGHRKIGFVDLKVASTRVHAIDAFSRSMAAHQLPVDEAQIVLYEPDKQPPLRRLYARGGLCPTALVTPYETLAQAVVTSLQEIGRSVPGDVSVVCLNGPGSQAGQHGPDFATAVPPAERMAALALRILTDEAMDGVAQHYVLKPSFYVGRTTAAPKQRPSRLGRTRSELADG